MEEENIQKIKVFLSHEFGTRERTFKRIKVHFEHNLIIKNFLPRKEEDSFMMIVYIKCLTCNRKIWNSTIRGKIKYLSSISNKVINFQNDLQQNEKMIKKKAKEYQDKELEKIEKSIVDKNKKILKKSIAIYKQEENLENLEYNKSKKFRNKWTMVHNQKINGLLNKYRENIEHIEDKGHFPQKPRKVIWCDNCQNFDSKGFCDIYDSYPLDYKIPVEEYCNEFLLDKVKAEKSKKRNKLIM